MYALQNTSAATVPVPVLPALLVLQGAVIITTVMEKMKIGIVGLQFGAQVIERQILQGPAEPYFRLAAVCLRHKAKAAAAAAKYGAKVYYRLEEMLADTEIRVIGLFTDPGGRAALIRQIIRADRDVMTTKPLERDGAVGFVLQILDESLGVLGETRNRVPARWTLPFRHQSSPLKALSRMEGSRASSSAAELACNAFSASTFACKSSR